MGSWGGVDGLEIVEIVRVCLPLSSPWSRCLDLAAKFFLECGKLNAALSPTFGSGHQFQGKSKKKSLF